jgi:hypothetical protein
LYDIVAALDVLRALGAESGQGRTERNAIMVRLGIERLPALEFSAHATLRTAASDAVRR